jgi:hypothetical protein
MINTLKILEFFTVSKGIVVFIVLWLIVSCRNKYKYLTSTKHEYNLLTNIQSRLIPEWIVEACQIFL